MLDVADRILIMNQGRITGEAKPDEIDLEVSLARVMEEDRIVTAQSAEAKNPTTWSSRARTVFARSGLLFGLIIPFALLWLFAPNFATQRNLFNVLHTMSINGMIACAMTFCVIISGDIDVSVGSAVAWASSLLGVLAIRSIGP